MAGTAGGFFGVSGGVVMIPILTGVLGLTQHQAHGTSLAVMGITAFVGIAVYAAHGNVAWVTAALIAATSMVTARYGARLAQRTTPHALTRSFAIFLAIVGLRLLWKLPPALDHSVQSGVAGIFICLALGAMVGLLSGYMGVGGGILVVPALTLLLGMPQKLAQGTSLAVILVAAPAGAIEHARHGNVVGRVVPFLAMGGVAGVAIASMFAQGLSGVALTRAFAVFMILNAVHMWLRADRAARKEPAKALHQA